MAKAKNTTSEVVESKIPDPLELIAALIDRVETLERAVHALERDNPKGITASAPVPLTGEQLMTIMERRPGAKFVSLAEYKPLGLRAGEVIEGRHRLPLSIVASHVTSGMKLVEAR